MSQSPPCWSRLHVEKCTKMRWIVSVGVIHNAWPGYLCGFRGRLAGSLNEMRAHWFQRKECRIFFLKCHVVKLWRVRYYFQEERLNSLPLRFFSSCLHPSSGGSCCASAILPLGGDSGQWITETTAELLVTSESYALCQIMLPCQRNLSLTIQWSVTHLEM